MTTALNSDSIRDEDALTWLIIWRASGKSPQTINLYAIVIAQLIEHFGKPLRDVTKLDAIGWLEMAQTRWQPGGVVSRLKAIRCFYNWLLTEEVIARTPWKGLAVKAPNDPQPTCSDEQLAAMLDGASRQETAVILLLAETGMRKGEAAALSFGDVSIADGMIHIRVSKSRPRVVPMSDRLVIAMQRWLRERGTAPGPLWVPRRVSQDAYSFIRTVLDNRSGGTISSHSLRRRFCVNWLLAGRSEASLARLMGWADTTMVAVYTRSAADQIAVMEYRRFTAA
jgi:integrase/recombinase XerC